MNRINCLIADDEMLAREVIKSHLDKLSDFAIAGNCANGLEVYEYLKNNRADLLFLDIQMPLISGIDLLKTLDNPPAVILTTAYREFALESYDLNVIDYLLKPISFERFLKAVNKYTRKAQNAPPVLQKVTDLDFIYIKSNGKLVRLLLKDILYLEGRKEFVMVCTTNGNYATHQTLTYFNEKLPDHLFTRLHRSYIASLNHITAFAADSAEIGAIKLPIGKAFMQTTVLKLKDLSSR